jgi:hypothetical protein
MKHILICIGVIVGIFGYGHSMQTPEQARKSAEVLSKMRQIDLLNQLIPLALQKSQITQLLPVVERARAKVTEIQKDEAVKLERLDAKITAAIKKSIESNVAPPKALLDELAQATAEMSVKRLVAVDANTTSVLKVFNEVCNAGQKAAAAHSLAPQLLNPSLKPDQMTQEDKIRFFIQEILLDPQCYDVLVQLEKHAS